ncbi:MAG: hypothetical protein QM749_01855 [Aquabacterium sp.]
MSRSVAQHAPVSPPSFGGHALLGVVATGALASLLTLGTAQAQMVPRNEHALRQNTGQDSLTTVRINIDGNNDAGDVGGKGLNLRGQGFWPHWEGRIGAVIDRPINPLKDSFVLAQPAQGGLHMRSMHVLSDYYIEGGFRATAGLLRGETGQAWWSSGDTGGGLNVSLQRLDSLGLLGAPSNRPSADTNGQQTMPYLGAGYTSRLSVNGVPSSWRLNADFGLVSISGNNANHLPQVFQGDKSLDDLVHEMRFRPMVKVSVGYSF